MNTHTLHLACTINGKSHKLSSHRKAYTLHMMRAEAELTGDGCKTVTGRRSMAKALRSMRLAHGLF